MTSKRRQKIALARTTLRNLTSAEASGAAGGGDSGAKQCPASPRFDTGAAVCPRPM